MKQISIDSKVFKTLAESVGNLAPETGAVIGAYDASPDCISHVWFDNKPSADIYIPSANAITAVVQKWMQENAHFCGIVHSHPFGFPELSATDMKSAVRIMESNRMDSMLLGLFHEGILHVYRITIDENGTPRTEKVEYIIKEE